MKKIKFLTIILVLCLSLNIFSIFAFAEDAPSVILAEDVISEFKETVLTQSYEEAVEQPEEDVTVPSAVTIDDNFAENLIIVYIKKEYSAVQQTYTVEDFPYLELSGVETVFEYVPEENNRVGLFLYLQESGKQNVLDAIELLLQDEKVYMSSPNTIFTLEDDNLTLKEESFSINIGSISDEFDANVFSGICCVQKYTNDFMGFNAQSDVAPIKIGIVDSGVCRFMPFHPKFFSTVRFVYDQNTDTATKTLGYEDPINMHGTTITNIITKSAETTGTKHNNGCGTPIYTGVCQNVQFYSLNLYFEVNNVKTTRLSCFLDIIDHANTVGIKILNISQRIKNLNSSDISAFETAIEQYNGIIITSAGNDNDNNDDDVDYIENNDGVDTLIEYPRGSDSDKVIVVGAADSTSSGAVKQTFSAYGQTTVDLFAYDTTHGYTCQDISGKYDVQAGFTYWNADLSNAIRCTRTGTSFAAARVSGAAAVLLDICRDLTPAQLRHYILAGVTPHSSLTNYCVTGGTLDVYRSAKMLIADLACDSETIFAGHFTDAANMQVAAYVKTTDTQTKCYVWTYNANTGEFSDPEEWFTDNSFYLNATNYSNMYRSVAGNFYGDSKDEICTLYNSGGDINYLYLHDSAGSKFIGSDISFLKCTGRVTCGDYDGDGWDEIAAFYQVPGVWAHTQIYIWNLTQDSSGNVTAVQTCAYNSNVGSYAAEYTTDRIVSGNFDSDGQEEIAALYRYSGGNYCLHRFDISTALNSAAKTDLIFNSAEVDVSKVNGRVVVCDYDGGIDEIVCLYDNSAVVENGIITYGFKLGTSSGTWAPTALHTTAQYNASLSKYLMVSGVFNGTTATGSTTDHLDDIVTFYKLPALNTLNRRGMIYMSQAPALNGYAMKWDSKA